MKRSGGGRGTHRQSAPGKLGSRIAAHRRRGLAALLISALALALASTALASLPHSAGHAVHRRHLRSRAPRHNYLAAHTAPPALLTRRGTRPVDLAVGSVVPQGAGALPGRSFKVLVQVKRVSHSPKTKIPGRLSAYLSQNSRLPAKRPASGGGAQVSVSAKGLSARTGVNFVVALGTTPGQYYLVACVAALGHFHDSHSKNNCASSHTLVTVSNPSRSGPLTSLLTQTPTGGGSAPTGPSENAQPKEEPAGENPPADKPVPVATQPPAPGPKDAAAPSAATVANEHELSTSESTSFRASIAFLFEAANPIQVGVKEPSQPQVITEAAAALIHGMVTDTEGKPIGGVRVAVLARGEYGYTDTASDGSFAMAVDGGGTLTLSYTRAGYIPVQNTVQVPVNQSIAAPAVALSAYQGQADDINLASSAPVQVAQGNVQSDTSGTRQSTLLFSSGTKATMQLPGGGEQELTDMHVRATEFTVGNYGPRAMPGSLPPTSEYTYASAFTVDEAVEQGATSVTFSKPVITYVENFLGFPTGAEVPSGTYEPASGQWGASSNGRVVKVLSTSAGVASLAVDSGGQPATQQELSELGITTDELKAIASLYEAGDSLWRVPISHFSSWDFNFLPEHERPEPPSPPENENPPQDESCQAPGGSTILCDSQAVAEDVPLIGTPFALHYQSDRVPSYRGANAIDVPVTSSTKPVPQSVDHVDVDVDILGHTYHQEYCMPGGKECEQGAEHPHSTSGIDYQVVWDRRDGFGRTVTGGATAAVTVTYWVGASYQCTESSSGGGGGGAAYNPDEFGSAYEGSGGCHTAARELTPVSDSEQVQIGLSANVTSIGLGDWSLNALDSYDPATGVLHSGDGADQSARAIAPVLSLRAGGGAGTKEEESEREAKGEELATEASLEDPQGVLELANGSVLIADCAADKVREVLPDGKITTFAGTGVEGSSGDGGPATKATLSCPSALAQAPDGSIYLADEFGGASKEGQTEQELLEEFSGRIRRIAPNGIITTVAGGGSQPAEESAGQPATKILLFYPGQIALAPDGSLYIADRYSGLVERVDTAGILSLVGYDPETGSAVSDPEGIAVNALGEVLVSDDASNQLVRISGSSTTVIAGNGKEGEEPLGDDGPATQAHVERPGSIAIGANGNIYFVEQSLPSRVRVITPSGIITTVAGTKKFLEGTFELAKGGVPATDAELFLVGGVFASTNGSLLIGADSGVYEMKASLAGVSDEDILVPTENGSRVDEFTAGGRERAVYDSTTSVKLLSFGYDSAGRLESITDQYGRKTTIARNGNGEPTAITAPEKQETKLAVNSGGELETITDPDGHTYKATYSPGQLSHFTDPRDGTSAIAYDSLGRLSSDTDQAGAETKLSSSIQTSPEGFTEKVVTVEAPGGLTTTYGDSQDGFGDSIRTSTDPSGGVSTYRSLSSGYTEISLPDGTIETAHSVGDPRFGMAAPITELLQVDSPDGKDDVQLSEKREVQFDPDDPLKVSKLTESVARGSGEPTITTYEPNESSGKVTGETITTKSPEGRETVAAYDADDDVASITEPFSANLPTKFTWDTEHGRVTQVSQGTRSKKFTYDTHGVLEKITNAAGASERYESDPNGWATGLIDPLGHEYHLGRDNSGDLTSLSTPSAQESKLSYTPVGLLESFSPEPGTSTKGEYNGRRQPTKLTLPEGSLEDKYDSAGRLEQVSSPNGDLEVSYVPDTSNPAKLERTNADSKTEMITPTFDGAALTQAEFSGPASGTYSYSYENGQLTDLSLHTAAGDGETPQSYDQDGLLSGSGEFTFAREDGSTGLVSEISGGTLIEQLGYDEFGEEESRSFEVEGHPVFSEELAREEETGRIEKRTDTVQSTAHTFLYSYDSAGRLTEVTLEGSPAQTQKYAYDSDGNLISRKSGAGAAEAITYEKGQETQLGATAYEYNQNGKLVKRGSDKFTYGARPGELISAELAGTTVTYDYDPFGRRVARTEGSGKAEQYLYGDPNDIYRLTASVAPDGTLTTYTYDHLGRLISFQRDDKTYYVASDLLGSPRVVTNTKHEVEKKLTYDAYGKVLEDSDPSFPLAIGYAGGLTDSSSGLVRFGMRDYEPASGRFTERDPTLFEGGLNPYAYAGDDPVDNIDPTGTDYADNFPSTKLTDAQMDQTLSNLSAAEDALNNPTPPAPTFLEKVGNALAGLRDKAADATGDFIQACKAFVNGSTPQSAIPLVEMGISKAAGEGPFEVTPGFMANQALTQGAQIIQGSPAGMGSYGSNQYSQVEDGH